jgi:hypothetical protein
MADDRIAIAPATAAPTAAPVLVKSFSAIDLGGNLVEIQAVILTDQYGRVMETPLSEATGRELLEMLRSINNVLVEYTSCGQYKGDSNNG